uniref:Tetratricopeptide repeat protein n=4 Tax=unclassified Prevotella TaxID=2638335 RepID=A0AB33JLN1_9BACT
MTNKGENVLSVLAEKVNHHADWCEYAAYYDYRVRGLRKEALKHLDVFLKVAESWSADKKREFVGFCFSLYFEVPDDDFLLSSYPLTMRLLKPTLEEWCRLEPRNAQLYAWYGRYFKSEEHLQQALRLNPEDDLCREALLEKYADAIWYSLHHLPDFYIGNPQDDLVLMADIRVHIDALQSEERKRRWESDYLCDLEIIQNYIAWQKSGHPDFEQWGRENNKITGYGLRGPYYYDK